MNKKQLIQIVVIIIAFGASGYVLYNGFFKNSKPVNLINVLSGGQTAGKDIEKILPNGETLNFEILQNRPNVQYGQLIMPKLNPKTEVGVLENMLIIPPEEKKP